MQVQLSFWTFSACCPCRASFQRIRSPFAKALALQGWFVRTCAVWGSRNNFGSLLEAPLKSTSNHHEPQSKSCDCSLQPGQPASQSMSNLSNEALSLYFLPMLTATTNSLHTTSQWPPSPPDSGPVPCATCAGRLARSQRTSGPSSSAPSDPSRWLLCRQFGERSATSTHRLSPSHIPVCTTPDITGSRLYGPQLTVYIVPSGPRKTLSGYDDDTE